MLTMTIETNGQTNSRVELDTGRRLVFGRSPKCDVVLEDSRVSREHFAIAVEEDGQLLFQHLGSKNPIYVNGFARDAAELSIGDVLSVGVTTLRVQEPGDDLDAEETSSASEVHLRSGSLDSSECVSISALETVFDESMLDQQPGRLQAFYQLSETFARTADLDTLFSDVLAHAVEHLPARRGFIALGDPHQDQFEVVKVKVPEAGDRTIEMSDTVLQEIQIRRESMLVRDAVESLEPTSDDSIRGLGIHAFMCAPLLVHDDFVGLLYVDQDDQASRRFEKHDLQYLQSMGRLLALAVDDRLIREHLERENSRLKETLRRKGEIVASCPPMLDVLTRVSRAAPRDTSVLLLGETGTGKECIARMLHEQSNRSDGPFIAFNCALSSPELIESELFGHKRGAFTDASSTRRGKLELANGGTLLLDEIGDMPLETQVKLLRAIQERRVWPVGSEDPIEVDFRLVAATHRDLNAMRRKNEFRDDLFYRIAVLTIDLPPLREREEDIVRIAERCLPEEFDIDPAARRALLAYPWPGNIRELQNAMEHASFNAPGETVRLHDLPKEIASVGRRDRVSTRVASLKEIEMRHIRRALDTFNGNKKRSAEALGISRETLYQKIKSYGL